MLENAEYLGTGHLLATRALTRYNDHVFGLLSRRLPRGGKLAEFGPGLGDFAERFQKAGMPVDAVEREAEFQAGLRQFSPRVVSTLAELPGLYDAIIAVNVLEHIEDDKAVLREFFAKLKPGGFVSLYHPAHQFLFSHLDSLVGHYRRYGREELSGKVAAAGFAIEEIEMVDSIGLAMCCLYKWLHWGDGNLSPGPMRFYDSFVWPLSRVLDAALGGRVGKSIFLLGRKP